jgi:hypothetical protein
MKFAYQNGLPLGWKKGGNNFFGSVDDIQPNLNQSQNKTSLATQNGVTAFGIFWLSIRSRNEEVEANRVANGVKCCW